KCPVNDDVVLANRRRREAAAAPIEATGSFGLGVVSLQVGRPELRQGYVAEGRDEVLIGDGGIARDGRGLELRFYVVPKPSLQELAEREFGWFDVSSCIKLTQELGEASLGCFLGAAHRLPVVQLLPVGVHPQEDTDAPDIFSALFD